MRNLLLGVVVGVVIGWAVNGGAVRAQGGPKYYQVATPGRGWIDCVIFGESISCLPQR